MFECYLYSLKMGILKVEIFGRYCGVHKFDIYPITINPYIITLPIVVMVLSLQYWPIYYYHKI